jgi:hypothetical protein
MLYFLDDVSPIHLYTDASNRGFGAYLCQIVDGIERPISFLSKSVAGSQKNWHTVEKEAFAIYWAIKELQHLLQHRHFTLHTDHANLVKIMEGGSPKVWAWKQAVAQYDFEIAYVKGEDNVVADAFSRLCSMMSSRAFDVELMENVSTNEREESLLCVLRPRRTRDWSKRIPNDVYRAIGKVHNCGVGHRGVQTTYELLKATMMHTTDLKYYVEKFIRECPICQKSSEISDPVVVKPFTSITLKPMQRINVDTIGPLPMDKNGFRYIVVIIDTFTRYMNTYPAKTLEGNECAVILN